MVIEAGDWVYSCGLCGWEPDDDLTVGVMKNHYYDKHPDRRRKNGKPDVSFNIVPRQRAE